MFYVFITILLNLDQILSLQVTNSGLKEFQINWNIDEQLESGRYQAVSSNGVWTYFQPSPAEQLRRLIEIVKQDYCDDYQVELNVTNTAGVKSLRTFRLENERLNLTAPLAPQVDHFMYDSRTDQIQAYVHWYPKDLEQFPFKDLRISGTALPVSGCYSGYVPTFRALNYSTGVITFPPEATQPIRQRLPCSFAFIFDYVRTKCPHQVEIPNGPQNRGRLTTFDLDCPQIEGGMSCDELKPPNRTVQPYCNPEEVLTTSDPTGAVKVTWKFSENDALFRSLPPIRKYYIRYGPVDNPHKSVLYQQIVNAKILEVPAEQSSVLLKEKFLPDASYRIQV